jgi:hypothetical protein
MGFLGSVWSYKEIKNMSPVWNELFGYVVENSARCTVCSQNASIKHPSAQFSEKEKNVFHLAALGQCGG